MAANASKATVQAKTKIPSLSSVPPRSTSPVTALKLQEMMDEYVDKIMLKVKQFTQELLKELEEQILNKVQKTVLALGEVIDDVAERADTQQKKCDAAHEKQKEEIAELQSQVTMLRYESMQFALRVRNLPESSQEVLKSRIASSLAPVLNCDLGVAMQELDCVYRVNSKIAEQKNLPRDVVIYFSRRACRNQVIQRYYQQKFQIDGFDIILLKEVPTSLLQRRKEFLFLTQELRRRKVLFRWNIPVGLTVTFDNKRHRLNTVQEAKDFYTLLLSSDSQMGGMSELSSMLTDSLTIQEGKDSQVLEVPEPMQVMTRAMSKLKFSKKK